MTQKKRMTAVVDRKSPQINIAFMCISVSIWVIGTYHFMNMNIIDVPAEISVVVAVADF